MSAEIPHAVTVGEAARHSALVAACAGLLFYVATVAVNAGDYGSFDLRALWITQYFLGWPVWAVLFTAVAQFVLTARKNLTTRWDFAWRGALASCIGVAVASMGWLLIVEVFAGQPGHAGGFFLVIGSLIGVIAVGGPLYAGVFAALWTPRRLTSARTGRTPLERADSQRRWGYVAFCGGGIICLGVIGASAAVANHNGFDYGCHVGGPTPTEPPLAVVSERSDTVTGSFSVWPVGLQCEWERADGLGTVTANSGAWGTTGLAAGGALIALLGAGLILTAPRR